MQRPTLGDVVLMIVVLHLVIDGMRMTGISPEVIIAIGFLLWLIHGYWRKE